MPIDSVGGDPWGLDTLLDSILEDDEQSVRSQLAALSPLRAAELTASAMHELSSQPMRRNLFRRNLIQWAAEEVQRHQRHCPSCLVPRSAHSYHGCSCRKWHYSTAAGWQPVPIENQAAEHHLGAEK